MNVLGVTAEYNPFHTGHQYQLQASRQLLEPDTAVVAVMSGNWIQQADCAIADKWVRSRLALMGGADLVLELPTPWATASAEAFCRGAVSLLHATGVVTHISFGSECGDVEALARIAHCLNSPGYGAALSGSLARGLSFPAARQEAVRRLLGDGADLLDTANNNLGVEYLRALDLLHSSITPITIPRLGAGHNSITTEVVPHISATQIRRAIRSGMPEQISPYLLSGEAELLEGCCTSSQHIHRAMLARLRSMSREDWANYPDSGVAEGLPQRLYNAARQSRSMEEFYVLAKTRRYTHARLRRLALRAFLGITADQLPDAPPYLRVLGFNGRGQQLLKDMKKNATLPLITKPAHARALDSEGRRLFELEARCTDLFDLCLDEIPVPGREWTTGPVILKEES